MKLKKKHKYKIRIILYLCFFLLTISIIYVCYFIITNLNLFLSDNSIHPKSGIASIESLSIPEIVYFLPTFNKTNDEINSILDQKFKLLRCSEEELINFSYSEGLFCDFDSFSHYVEGKVLLGKNLN